MLYYLEDRGIVNPLNEIHLHALDCVFLQKISYAITEFKTDWNDHPLSTEHNLSTNPL